MNACDPSISAMLLHQEGTELAAASEMADILAAVGGCDGTHAARIGADPAGVRLTHANRSLGARIDAREERNVRVLVDVLDPEFDVVVGRVLLLVLPKFPVGDGTDERRAALIDACAKAGRVVRTAIDSIDEPMAGRISDAIGREMRAIAGGIVAACGVSGTGILHAPTPWCGPKVTSGSPETDMPMPPAIAGFVVSRIRPSLVVDLSIEANGRCHVDMAVRLAPCDAWDATSTMRLLAGILPGPEGPCLPEGECDAFAGDER